jgi:hypothetical protein
MPPVIIVTKYLHWTGIDVVDLGRQTSVRLQLVSATVSPPFTIAGSIVARNANVLVKRAIVNAFGVVVVRMVTIAATG